MQIYATVSSKKKNFFHIYVRHDEKSYRAYCAKGEIALWVHNAVKPEVIEYTGQQLCPLCVGNAYKYGLLEITPTR